MSSTTRGGREDARTVAGACVPRVASRRMATRARASDDERVRGSAVSSRGNGSRAMGAQISSRVFRSPRVVMADGDAVDVESEEIRCGGRVFTGRPAAALHEHPVNKDLIAHFKSKGDSVSWGITESIEKYEEDTKKKVSWGTDIASLYDQETERELAREVENRIEEALSAGVWYQSCTAAARGADENKSKPDVQKALKLGTQRTCRLFKVFKVLYSRPSCT